MVFGCSCLQIFDEVVPHRIMRKRCSTYLLYALPWSQLIRKQNSHLRNSVPWQVKLMFERVWCFSIIFHLPLLLWGDSSVLYTHCSTSLHTLKPLTTLHYLWNISKLASSSYSTNCCMVSKDSCWYNPFLPVKLILLQIIIIRIWCNANIDN